MKTTSLPECREYELKRAADQADAWGHIERARWYRIWARTGRQIGPKPPIERNRNYHGGPLS